MKANDGSIGLVIKMNVPALMKAQVSSSLGRAKNSRYQRYLVPYKISIIWFHTRTTMFLWHQWKAIEKSFLTVSWLTFGSKNWPQKQQVKWQSCCILHQTNHCMPSWSNWRWRIQCGFFWGEIGEIYSLLTFGLQNTTHRIFYLYIYSPFCDQSLCHTWSFGWVLLYTWVCVSCNYHTDC